MPSRSKMIASSFISAMLRSRCVFSITLAASATRMLDARCTPAVTMLLYIRSTSSSVSGVSPETTLMIFVSVRSLSPGLMRSGRVADEEVGLPLHSRMLFHDRDADFLGRAGIDGRLEHHRRTALHVLADGLRRADQRAEIRLMRVVHRRRHGDDDEIGFGERGRIVVHRQLRRGTQVGAAHLAGRIDVIRGSARPFPPTDRSRSSGTSCRTPRQAGGPRNRGRRLQR